MKILIAGATGVVGRALVPRLVAAGHEVSGTSRRRENSRLLEEMGAHPVIVDVLDARKLKKAVKAERPDVVIHQLTDLSGNDFEANGLLRINGTRNLVDAAKAAGVETMIAQSIAWLYVRGEEPAVEGDELDPHLPPYKSVTALEEAVADMPRGVVLRYGALYGPGTWYAADGEIAAKVKAGELSRGPMWTSFVHVEDAAAAAVAALEWEPGAVNIVDDESATADEWVPAYAAALGAPEPRAHRHAAAQGRPVSNARARALGWSPAYPTWRDGLL
ncbi:NAD(P)-dependent oxidoreductase [Actinocorallia sp. API 0066]|uniref:NAD-dependent epimerase/dehydratase family protein n=1 Tax=Actinocorallia sp. API 0066 TaxID=2896846 RepID=UPI001E356D2E|nr:NAD(P)-dependent oxidoreductase [Actinocorallia sp. API 0066]MCD0450535.1 NAD(P)-dependent oxidoreductase [Actinocorallia sp. API 0066]